MTYSARVEKVGHNQRDGDVKQYFYLFIYFIYFLFCL